MVLKRYIVKRLLQIIPVLFAVITINFVLLHLAPGDVAIFLAGRDADPEYIEAVREAYGLTKPLHQQYFSYLNQLLHGNLGYSWSRGQPVLNIILNKLPNTILLLGTCAVLVVAIGIILGTIAARNYPGKIDKVISYTSQLLYSMPIYWFGLMLIYLFAVKLKWFPFLGMKTIGVPMSPLERILDILWHMFLPVVSLTLIWFGSYARITRASIIEVSKEDYITTAKAIGYDNKTIFYHHALRNALLPVLTMTGLTMGFIVSGSVLTETVFAWPGMGRLIYNAVLARDYPLIIGCYIIISIVVSLSVLITDVLYAIVDPRVRYE